MNKNILYDSIKSICYETIINDEKTFIKQYKHLNIAKINYEFTISSHLYNNGFSCPKPRWVNNDCIAFDYINLKKFEFGDFINYSPKFMNLLSFFGNIIPPQNIRSWDDYIKMECIDEIEASIFHLKEEGSIDYRLLENIYGIFKLLKGEIIVHNDMGLYNIGINIDNQSILFFDFEHVSLGPTNWDLAYFLCLLDCNKVQNLFKNIELNQKLLQMIICACLIKLGRAIRKKNDLSTFIRLLKNWTNEYNTRLDLC